MSNAQSASLITHMRDLHGWESDEVLAVASGGLEHLETYHAADHNGRMPVGHSHDDRGNAVIQYAPSGRVIGMTPAPIANINTHTEYRVTWRHHSEGHWPAGHVLCDDLAAAERLVRLGGLDRDEVLRIETRVVTDWTPLDES